MYEPKRSESTKALDAKLLQAQRSLVGVGQTGHNTHQRYKYTTIDEMVATCRRPLLEAGLVFRRFHEWRDGDMLHVVWRLSDPESGEFEEHAGCCPVVPGKGREADKAHNAAESELTKYLYRGLLQVPRGEEYEVDARDTYDPVESIHEAAARQAKADAKAQCQPKSRAEGARAWLRARATLAEDFAAFCDAKWPGQESSWPKMGDLSGDALALNFAEWCRDVLDAEAA